MVIKTDLEKFQELYQILEINHWIEELEEETRIYIGDYYMQTGIKGTEYNNSRTVGYTGFYSMIYFTNRGEFIEQGFWE